MLANNTSANFSITTSTVSVSTAVTITASYNGASPTATLTVNPVVALQSVSVNPTSVTGGQGSTGTVTLTSAAPSGGITVNLSSNNAAAQVPSSVTVLANNTSANFSITTSTVSVSTAVTITASYNGASPTATLTVNPVVALQSVSVNPTSVTGGQGSTGTVTLTSAAPSGGITVNLSSNNAAAQVPSSVTVLANNTSANFSITTSTVSVSTAVTITASYNGASPTATLTVNPVVALQSVSVNPTSVTGGQGSTGTVTLTSAAPSGGITVNLSSNNAAAQVPSSVTVLANNTSANFSITTSTVSVSTPVTITASYNGASPTATLTVNPVGSAPPLAVVQAQQKINGGNALTSISVSIATTAGDLLVAFVREGSNATDNFTVTDSQSQTWTLAGYNSFSSSERCGIYYKANSAVVTSVTAHYTTVGGVTRAGIVVYEISGAAASTPVDAGPSGTSFNTTQSSITSALLTTTNANDILIFAVDVSGNQSGTNNGFVPGTGFAFPATGSATDARQAVAYEIISSTQTNLRTSMSWGTKVSNGASQFIAFKAASATNNSPALQSVSVNPTTVTGGQGSTGTVTLTSAAPSGGISVGLSSNNAAAQVPSSVTVLANNTSANFSITTSTVSVATPVTISASYNGASPTATLTVNPVVALQSVSVNPTSVTGGQGSTGTVTLTSAAPTGGISVGLSSNNAAAQVPSSVTVLANNTSANFSITTSTVSVATPVTITASYNGASPTATLTVNPVGSAPPLAVVQAQQNLNANSGVTSIAANITTTAGDLLVAFVREGSNATDNFTVTDSQGQTWTLAGYNSFSSSERCGIYYMPNSAAVTSVTAKYTTSGGVIRAGIVVYEISGAATSSPVDAGPIGTSFGSTQSSITSASLTTTNAKDILIFAVDVSGNQSGTNNSFVPGGGFSFAATGSATDARQAVAYEIVSLTQTNLTTSMSWGTAVGNGASQFVAFKAGQ